MQPSTGIQAQLKSSGAADAMDYVVHCTDGHSYHIKEPAWGRGAMKNKTSFIRSGAKSTHTGKYKGALVLPL